MFWWLNHLGRCKCDLYSLFFLRLFLLLPAWSRSSRRYDTITHGHLLRAIDTRQLGCGSGIHW